MPNIPDSDSVVTIDDKLRITCFSPVSTFTLLTIPALQSSIYNFCVPLESGPHLISHGTSRLPNFTNF